MTTATTAPRRRAPRRPPIEHPASMGEGHRRLLDGLTSAYRVALDLIEHGHHVIGMRAVTPHLPTIHIAHSPRCAALRGAARIIRNGPLGREQVMVAIVDGCRVEWLARGD